MKFIFPFAVFSAFLSCLHGSKISSSRWSASSYSYKTDLTKDNWLTAKKGRTVYLFGTGDEEKIKKFIPSGLSPQRTIIAGWEIVLYPPVFYSNEENPDTSKDQSSSALIYNKVSGKKQPVFVGKGYKFFIIKNSAGEKADFALRYWSGVMGCSFIDLYFSKSAKAPSVKYRSTKDVSLCESSAFEQLDGF